MGTNRYSAPGSTMGSLAQVQFALLRTLQSTLPEDAEISLETADDFVIDASQAGGPTQLFQAKHHANAGTLTDLSSDLWKSIGNWLEDYDASAPSVRLFLTTQVAQQNSGVWHLSQSRVDYEAAVDALVAAANSSRDTATELARLRFLSLGVEVERFVATISIQDAAPTADQIAKALRFELRRVVSADRTDALVERLVGWWHGVALEQMKASLDGRVIAYPRIADVNSKVDDLRDQLSLRSLPLDYDDDPEPSEEDVAACQARYMQQLRWIGTGIDRLLMAKHDHDRAYVQRSRWQQESLVGHSDLARYDQRLVRAWRNIFAPMTDDGEATDGDAAMRARELYYNLFKSPLPEPAPDLSGSYVSGGSLHILAGDARLGWHPEWRSRMTMLADAEEAS